MSGHLLLEFESETRPVRFSSITMICRKLELGYQTVILIAEYLRKCKTLSFKVSSFTVFERGMFHIKSSSNRDLNGKL